MSQFWYRQGASSPSGKVCRAPERGPIGQQAMPRPGISPFPSSAMNCPACGGEMWDNRPKKASGAFKPTAPDFKCKNPDCKHVEWPKDDAAKTTPPTARKLTVWDEVHALYGRALWEAKKIAEAPTDIPVIATGLAVLAAARGVSAADAHPPAPAAPTRAPAAPKGPAFDDAPLPEAPPEEEEGLPF